jgi:hypothetical protein
MEDMTTTQVFQLMKNLISLFMLSSPFGFYFTASKTIIVDVKEGELRLHHEQ